MYLADLIKYCLDHIMSYPCGPAVGLGEDSLRLRVVSVTSVEPLELSPPPPIAVLHCVVLLLGQVSSQILCRSTGMMYCK